MRAVYDTKMSGKGSSLGLLKKTNWARKTAEIAYWFGYSMYILKCVFRAPDYYINQFCFFMHRDKTFVCEKFLG